MFSALAPCGVDAASHIKGATTTMVVVAVAKYTSWGHSCHTFPVRFL